MLLPEIYENAEKFAYLQQVMVLYFMQKEGAYVVATLYFSSQVEEVCNCQLALQFLQ